VAGQDAGRAGLGTPRTDARTVTLPPRGALRVPPRRCWPPNYRQTTKSSTRYDP